MASYSGLLAYTGFHYSAVTGIMKFNNLEGKYFWSNGYQYGTIEINTKAGKKTAAITVLNGSLKLRSFKLNGIKEVNFKNEKIFNENETVVFEI